MNKSDWTWKHKVILWKSYFDTGMALTTLPREAMKLIASIVGIGGIVSGKEGFVYYAVLSAFLYYLSCPIVGWGFYKYGWVEITNDVSNYFNPLLRRVEDGVLKIVQKLR